MLNKDGEFPNEKQHDAIQQEFMAKVHRQQASAAEEKERQRRLDEIAMQVPVHFYEITHYPNRMLFNQK